MVGAGIYGPELGRSIAKEKFAIFGYMGGIYLIGIIMILFLFIKFGFKNKSTSQSFL